MHLRTATYIMVLGLAVCGPVTLAIPAAAATVSPSQAYRAKQQYIYAETVSDASSARLMDDRLIAKQKDIDGLRGQLNRSQQQLTQARTHAKTSGAEVARLTAEVDRLSQDLAQAQEYFVNELAKRDYALNQQINYMRDNVDRILATPEGLLGLQMINAGNIAGGAAVLDTLNQARAAARRKALDTRYNIETAADQRATAAVLLGHESVAQSAARFEAITALDPSVASDWVELARLYMIGYRLDDALRTAQKAAELAGDDYDRAAALDELGNIYLQRNQLDEALAAYQDGLTRARTRAAANPSDLETQRALADSLSKVGDVYSLRNQLDLALAVFQEDMAINRTLAAGSSDDRDRRGLGVALKQVGDVYLERNQLDEALAAHQEQLTIMRSLAAGANDRDTLRDLATSLMDLGIVYQARNQLDEALKAYQEGLAVERGLAADPSNARAQRELSVFLNKIGDIQAERNQTDLALAAYQEGLTLVRAQATDASNAGVQRDLSVSLNKIGDMYVARDQTDLALAAYRESLAIRRGLAKDLTNALAQRDVVISLAMLAGLEGSGVGWQAVIDQLLFMKSRNLLMPADEGMLDDARTNRVEEQAAAKAGS